MKKLQVLLTNDDGFHADGLQTLYRHLREIATITIVAPDRERSAVGHGITMHHPLRAVPTHLADEVHWLVDGTPADCVKLALECLCRDQQPDLVISGINRGPNLGNDVLYSGTVAAAMEASFYAIPSIAASLDALGKMDFTKAAVFIENRLPQLWELAKGSLLNLNFPDLDASRDYCGVKFTKLGRRIYQNVFEERRDPRGRNYFWMSGDLVSAPQDADSDMQAVMDGYVSITPLQSDLTNYTGLKKLCQNPFL